MLKAYEDVEDLLYFFVARKSEEELCKDFSLPYDTEKS